MSDLFEAAAETRRKTRAPLAERLRPTTLDEVVGQDHLLGPGRPLRALVAADRLSSLILWGPPGCGKTTLARLVAAASSNELIELSAVSATVKDVREVIAEAKQRLGGYNRGTVLFLDEVHRFNRAQQDTLLPAVESGHLILIGATTENPYFEINAPLRSRSTLFQLEPLDSTAVTVLLRRGLDMLGVEADEDALGSLADLASGDARHAIGALDIAAALAQARVAESASGLARISLEDVEAALSSKALVYGVDGHYDAASALIKSIRGSDPDAALYWLAHMLQAGEDARFVARRLVILASEDVGLADPVGLMVATAAAQAVEFVGLPEAQLNLAHAALYLALAPKSNSVTSGLGAAQQALQRRDIAGVPAHLRSAGHPGLAAHGHGVGYRYPHDDPRGWLEQQYLPDELQGEVFWRPLPHGREGPMSRQWAQRTEQAATAGPTDDAE